MRRNVDYGPIRWTPLLPTAPFAAERHNERYKHFLSIEIPFTIFKLNFDSRCGIFSDIVGIGKAKVHSQSHSHSHIVAKTMTTFFHTN